ncbi:hypothetical protein SLEP1_g4468 [Rubroshorea leprosula]|uniref:Uncharacterized protein n=1 Tax=Rubroshorea leprosula TaxID=152421 RepID=A0AAV5HUK8_9ROSI|nr:hypothetical protein SLEP1_g4468 [Rubroshorea leprosula]GKU90480.1 hypothetical protein SLEP1_g4468 [Rubroshorea leprosula]
MAISSKTGRVLWRFLIVEMKPSYSISANPIWGIEIVDLSAIVRSTSSMRCQLSCILIYLLM